MTLKHELFPEGKTVKNRLHLDLRPSDQSAEVARLEALGARQVSIGQGDVSWVVMADPDGNEFDVLQPLTPDELPPGHDSLGRRIAAGARPLRHNHQLSAPTIAAIKFCGRDQNGGSARLRSGRGPVTLREQAHLATEFPAE